MASRHRPRERAWWFRHHLEIEAKSEQEPPLIGELEIPGRLQGVKRPTVEKVLYLEEGEAAFVGELTAQSQVHDDKGDIRPVSVDIPILLHQKRPDPRQPPLGVQIGKASEGVEFRKRSEAIGGLVTEVR